MCTECRWKLQGVCKWYGVSVRQWSILFVLRYEQYRHLYIAGNDTRGKEKILMQERKGKFRVMCS